MKEVRIFIRKKSNSYQHSIERFAMSLKKIKKKQIFKVKIIKCPVTSKGILSRIYLVLWSFFNQGDVNHILGDINFISILMNKKKTINTFLDCRLINEFSGLKKFIYKWFWFYLPIGNSAYNTFISKFTLFQIQKNLKKKIYNSEVIPVPLVDKFNFKINLRKKKKILIIGTLKHKNLKNMLIALEGLNIDLTIVGEISLEIKSLCLKKDILFKNYVSVSDNFIKKLFKENDILLMVSKYEGFGMPVLEAQSSGMAVITSNIEPMRTVAGDQSILVNPNKPNEIKKNIKKLISNKDYYLKNIKRGKQNSLNYDSFLINKKYMKLYSKILN